MRRRCAGTIFRKSKFQSTHSLRSATVLLYIQKTKVYVSIHALLAECDAWSCPGGAQVCGFNPRTPCGVRLKTVNTFRGEKRFQSTHSLRSATRATPPISCRVIVSIHALLAECDKKGLAFLRTGKRFQSTHSLRSATNRILRLLPAQRVSIHALLAECDNTRKEKNRKEAAFQSTHSLRSATRNAG